MGIYKTLCCGRYRKQLKTVPFFFTFANAFLGFVAITQAFEGQYEYAVYSLFCAAFMDLCDGRIARALGSTSVIGLELDSLADGISFVLAPCVIWYLWYPGIVGVSGWIALACYLSAGLYRLARFNVTAAQQSEYSMGMPVPAAAISLASFILYHEWLSTHTMRFLLYKRMPFVIMLLLSLLMISKIPFPVFKKWRVTQRSSLLYASLIGILLGLSILIVRGYPVLLISIGIYVGIAMLNWHRISLLASRDIIR